MSGDDRRWLAGSLLALAIAAAAPVVVLQALGTLDNASDKRLAAVLTLVGVTVTACASLIGAVVRRQSERRLEREHGDEEARLRLDAAMHAGALFNANGDLPADPAAVASGLLALTQLGRADLAVALLVDLWDEKAADEPRHAAVSSGVRPVSDETAILVLDAALRSNSANAQLVAAELLCRNSSRLDICQSLHWPSSLDGTWNEAFGVKTKVLIVDALVRMAYEGAANQNALQSLAVRLYGISAGDQDPHVKGCVGMLLDAIVPALVGTNVRSLMQGPSEISINDIKAAAAKARPNPDRVFFRVVEQRSIELTRWANECRETDFRPGALAAASVSATADADRQ
jgi:hypothetical protein